jgi:acetyltransferase-like isoleucine patch superfamily enzyme
MLTNPIPDEFSTGQTLPIEILRKHLKAVGKNVAVYRGARFVGASSIELGDFTQIDEGVRIFAGLGVRIGRHVHLAFDSSISGGGECVIADFAGVAAGVRIITGSEGLQDGLTNPTIPPEFRVVSRNKVVIGSHALIFTNAIILPGVTVGEGAVVSAGSVVHRDLKPWSIYAGFPLVQIGIRNSTAILEKARELLQTEQIK